MGKKFVIDEQTMKSIANEIRNRGAHFVGTDKMTPEEMARDKIGLVYHNGCADGITQGIEIGKEEGEQAEYDRFWDSFQDNGNQTDYNYAFSAAGWTVDTFKPKYDIVPTTSNAMFYSNDMAVDLVELLENAGVKLDFSKSTNISALFNSSKFTHIGIISTVSAEGLPSVFGGVPVVTIDGLVLKDDGSQTFNTACFQNCSRLTHMPVSGTIGQNGFNVQWSPLDHESLMSYLYALEDKTEDTSGTIWVITIGETNKAKLTDDELDVASAKGWLVE